MRLSDGVSIGVTTLLGGLTGWLVAGTVGAAIGAFASGTLAFIGVRANVRPAIVSTVLVGAMSGVLIGSSIVAAICLPDTCHALEVTGGISIGGLTFIGVGLVAALVTRSFDEYNEQQQPPE